MVVYDARHPDILMNNTTHYRKSVLILVTWQSLDTSRSPRNGLIHGRWPGAWELRLFYFGIYLLFSCYPHGFHLCSRPIDVTQERHASADIVRSSHFVSPHVLLHDSLTLGSQRRGLQSFLFWGLDARRTWYLFAPRICRMRRSASPGVMLRHLHRISARVAWTPWAMRTSPHT